MPSSGSVDFSVNRNDIITRALEVIGEYAAGETIASEDVTTCAAWLNLIVKQWQGTSDFAPGLKTWSRKRGYIFLAKNQSEYDLGPSGDHATSTYYTTTLDADEASSQTTISVTSTTNMTNSDNIGIELNDGTLHWSTISSFSAGDTVTIATGLASAASSGNRVFWYTTKMRRPIKILTAHLRTTSTEDSPLYPMSLEEYESIPTKTSDSDPNRYFYEEQLTNGMLYLDSEPTDVTKVIRIVFLSNIEDFDTSTDTPDYPQEYYLALVMELAKYVAPVFGKDFTPTMEDNRKSAVAVAKNLNPEKSKLYYQCNAE